MKKNIGLFDRILRLLIGLVAFAGVFFVSQLVLKIGLLAVAIFCAYEALVGWCAFYALIGKNTCPIE